MFRRLMLNDPVAQKSSPSECRRYMRRNVLVLSFVLVVSFLVIYQIHSRRKSLLLLSRIGLVDSTPCVPPANWSGDNGIRHRFPKAVIVGIRKGGTRALLNMLGLHPCVKIVSREVHFFDRETVWRRGPQWYLEQFPVTTDYEVAMEKSPAYFITPEVPQRINNVLPNVKLIVILRNPVERLVSDFMQMMSKHWSLRPQPALDLRNFTREELDKLHSRFVQRFFLPVKKSQPEKFVVRASHPAVRLGIYHKHLSSWWRYIERDRIAVVCGEKFVSNPVPVLEQLTRFLGLDYIRFPWEDNIELNQSKGFYCPTAHDQVLKKKRTRCLGEDKGRQHIRPSLAVMKTLYDFYTRHNEKLFRMLGKRCSWISRTRHLPAQKSAVSPVVPEDILWT